MWSSIARQHFSVVLQNPPTAPPSTLPQCLPRPSLPSRDPLHHIPDLLSGWFKDDGSLTKCRPRTVPDMLLLWACFKKVEISKVQWSGTCQLQQIDEDGVLFLVNRIKYMTCLMYTNPSLQDTCPLPPSNLRALQNGTETHKSFEFNSSTYHQDLTKELKEIYDQEIWNLKPCGCTIYQFYLPSMDTNNYFLVKEHWCSCAMCNAVQDIGSIEQSLHLVTFVRCKMCKLTSALHNLQRPIPVDYPATSVHDRKSFVSAILHAQVFLDVFVSDFYSSLDWLLKPLKNQAGFSTSALQLQDVDQVPASFDPIIPLLNFNDEHVLIYDVPAKHTDWSSRCHGLDDMLGNHAQPHPLVPSNMLTPTLGLWTPMLANCVKDLDALPPMTPLSTTAPITSGSPIARMHTDSVVMEHANMAPSYRDNNGSSITDQQLCISVQIFQSIIMGTMFFKLPDATPGYFYRGGVLFLNPGSFRLASNYGSAAGLARISMLFHSCARKGPGSRYYLALSSVRSICCLSVLYQNARNLPHTDACNIAHADARYIAHADALKLLSLLSNSAFLTSKHHSGASNIWDPRFTLLRHSHS
ncbi:uncharacterized protein F5147DRAFT_658820 [Suillus discolor]|uniref:Uncharacterized protein n=1 Tax=Suillus discolor TaxID=1912936 RepID=A0A9P7ES77_9AGAM|nr:uncharacterized protein F5147DRAFT_658820 [Suillus discolor]KAG2088015.1 hypothetical protein F5147DRAFT_658820 [Suillus discolor]